MHRRRLLVLGSAALLPAIGGCIGNDFDPVEPKERLGSADAISLEASPERGYEYHEADDSVTTDSGAEMPFDEWGTRRATAHASAAVRKRLAKLSLLVSGVSTGSGRTVLNSLDELEGDDRPTEDDFDRDFAISPIVSHQHLYDRGGNLIREPEVPFERIVEETPRVAAVTMLFPEREYRAILPVVCQRRWIREE